MSSIEVTAKNLDEAKKIAADRLGVDASQIITTVLEESKGLFGKSSLRVKAEVADAPAAKAVVEEIVEEATAPEPPAKKGRAPRKPKAEKAEAAAPVAEEAPAAEAAEEEAGPQVVATQADADQLLGLVNDLLSAGDLRAEARISDVSGKYVSIQIDGKDTSHLVGKNGEVLNQLQYLLNVMAAQQFHNGIRITLDGNDYRHKREEQLTTLATKIAEQVQLRGEEAVLDALPAFERRIIHKVLADNPAIATYSEGEEPNRRVVIAPAE